MTKRLGTGATLNVLGITSAQVRECLSAIKEFTESHNMRYTIINAKPMTKEWTDVNTKRISTSNRGSAE